MDKMTIQERKSLKKTTALLLMLLVALGVLTAFFVWTLTDETLFDYRIMGVAALVMLILVVFVVIAGMVAFRRLWYNKPIPSWILSMSSIFIKWLYPPLLQMSRWFDVDKDDIRRAYTRLNNQVLLSRQQQYESHEVLIVTPHCLQQSTCGIKITSDITQCQACGACNVSELLDLQRRYGVETVVVTGGTLARKSIKDKHPALVIAIACERDLMSGLMDVRQVPVFALINERPEGPCRNTRVNITEVEQVLNRFLKR